MRIPRFFSPVPLSPDSTISLDGQVARHIGRALRMTPGDALVLFDGTGGEYPATIESIGKQSVSVKTAAHNPADVESPLAITLGISISRGDRMDHVVQKATELGVTRISPLVTERTEVRLKGERAEKKNAHWQQVAISACEQSGRNRVPRVDGAQTLDEWLAKQDASHRLVLHHRADARALSPEAPASIALLVGPEGGLGPEEIERAEDSGFVSLALGPRVLRTETAPLVAVALLQSRWGDLP